MNPILKNAVKAIAPSAYHYFKLYLNKILDGLDEKIKTRYDFYINSAIDTTPDERDVNFEEVAGSPKLPARVLLSDGILLDQGKTNLCVAYASASGINESLYFLGSKPNKDPNVVADYIRKNLDPDIDKEGTWVIHWPKALNALGWIEGYTQTNTLEAIKKALYYGLSVQSWTNKLNWGKTHKNAVAVRGAGGGHAISLVGFDDNLTRTDGYGNTYTGFLIAENTWGDDYGDNGRYYIPYEFAMDILYNTKKCLIVSREATRKHTKELIEKMRQIKKEKWIKVVETKYAFFNDDYHLLEDQENRELFQVLQDTLKETGYIPKNRTIIGGNADRTNARIYTTIMLARESK